MTKKAYKTPFEQNTSYTDWTPKDTPDITALRDFEDMPETLQPALEAQFNRAKERNANAYRSQYNQNLTPAARLALERENDRGLTADYGSALGQAAFDAKDSALRRRMYLAGLTAPRPLVNRVSGYGSQVANNWFGDILNAGAQVGSAAILASDERLKKNIRPTTGVLDKLDGYEAKEWDWKDGSGHQAGVVAQDVQQQFPEAVEGEPDGDEPMMVNYGDASLAAQALQGVKELNQEVKQLRRAMQMRHAA